MNDTLTKIKTFVVTYWAIIRDVIVGALGIFLLKDFFQKNLKAQLQNDATVQKATEIEAQKTVIQNNIQNVVDDNQKLVDDRKAEDSSLADANHQDVEDYYNPKK